MLRPDDAAPNGCGLLRGRRAAVLMSAVLCLYNERF